MTDCGCDFCDLPACAQLPARPFDLTFYGFKTNPRPRWELCPSCLDAMISRNFDDVAIRATRTMDRWWPEAFEHFDGPLIYELMRSVAARIDANRIGPAENLVVCTHCQFYSAISGFDSFEDIWFCPGCGMDESGLENLPESPSSVDRESRVNYDEGIE